MRRRGHIPIRMCIGCRKRRKKEEMIRVTRTIKKNPPALFEKEREGKGIYLCPEISCLKAAKKKSRLDLSLEIARFEECFEKIRLTNTH